MNDIITIRSTSKDSAQGEDIILRETARTRLLFRPLVVNNPHDSAASIKGTFIFQEKKMSGDWCDYKTLDLSKLRDGEWIKLELKSAELHKLFTALDRYYGIYETYGIQRGEHDFIVTPKNTKEVIASFLRNPENFAKLQELRVEDLRRLTVLANLNSLKSVLQTWKDQSSNGDEEFWQRFFKRYSWVIAQVFSCPVVLFKDKAYVGGKTLDNTGGSIVDFIFKNQFTESVLIVEIKTPLTSLVGSKYRDGAYCLSSALSGSLSQILQYKHELQKNYVDLQREARQFNAFDPKCMLIVGNVSAELRRDPGKMQSFSLVRNDSRNVAIVTYDELFAKVAMLISLLEE